MEVEMEVNEYILGKQAIRFVYVSRHDGRKDATSNNEQGTAISNFNTLRQDEVR